MRGVQTVVSSEYVERPTVMTNFGEHESSKTGGVIGGGHGEIDCKGHNLEGPPDLRPDSSIVLPVGQVCTDDHDLIVVQRSTLTNHPFGQLTTAAEPYGASVAI